MTDFCCAVVLVGREWTIAYKGRKFGVFDDQACALDAAMRLAGDVARGGGHSEVLVQSPTGELRVQARM